MDIGGWLRSLGLERYEAAFRENEIDETVLPTVTAEDLKDLVSISLDTVVSCSMPSLLCKLTQPRSSGLPKAPRRSKHCPRTRPSDAKLQ